MQFKCKGRKLFVFNKYGFQIIQQTIILHIANTCLPLNISYFMFSGLVQDCGNSIANTAELVQSCSVPSCGTEWSLFCCLFQESWRLRWGGHDSASQTDCVQLHRCQQLPRVTRWCSSGQWQRHFTWPGTPCGSLQGPYSLRRRRLISIGIPIINLRRSSDRLRFIMGIPIPVRRRLLSE